jgi:integrase
MSLIVHDEAAARPNSAFGTSSNANVEFDLMSQPVPSRPHPCSPGLTQLAFWFTESQKDVPSFEAIERVKPLHVVVPGTDEPPIECAFSIIQRTLAPDLSVPVDALGQEVAPLPSNLPMPMNIDEVMRRLEEQVGPDHIANRNMRSALRALGRVTNKPLEAIPTDPALLRALMDGASSATAGISSNRWMRVRSLVTSALTATGVPVMRGRISAEMTQSWGEMHAALPGKKLRFGLSRLLRWFSQAGIEPHQVDAAALANFRAAAVTTSLRSLPSTANQTFRLWNTAAAKVPGWPQIQATIERDVRRYAIAIDRFPASFRDELDRFLTRTTLPNPFADDYAPPVQASTAARRRRCLIEVASALVLSGFALENVVGLRVLVEPVNAATALQHLHDRRRGTKGSHLAQQAQLLVTLAKHHVRAAPADVERLKKFVNALTPPRPNMVERNRERLRQFDLPANLTALLHLPRRVLSQVERKGDKTHTTALRVMNALAVEILTVAPIRIDNLCGLEIDRHIVETKRGRHTTRHIIIPAKETKTQVPFEKELSPETCRLLDQYVTHYRPLIDDSSGPWLFPGRGGGRRTTTRFSTNISNFIFRETGLRIHSHLFRHLAAKIRLEHDHTDIETVRQVLGHKSSDTTLRSYADIRTDQALKRYESTVARLRDASPASSCIRNPGSKKRT